MVQLAEATEQTVAPPIIDRQPKERIVNDSLLRVKEFILAFVRDTDERCRSKINGSSEWIHSLKRICGNQGPFRLTLGFYLISNEEAEIRFTNDLDLGRNRFGFMMSLYTILALRAGVRNYEIGRFLTRAGFGVVTADRIEQQLISVFGTESVDQVWDLVFIRKNGEHIEMDEIVLELLDLEV